MIDPKLRVIVVGDFPEDQSFDVKHHTPVFAFRAELPEKRGITSVEYEAALELVATWVRTIFRCRPAVAETSEELFAAADDLLNAKSAKVAKIARLNLSLAVEKAKGGKP